MEQLSQQKLQLPNVTLLCIDTASHALALHAILHSMKKCDFGHVVWLTDQQPPNLSEILNIQVEIIPTIETSLDYSQLVLKTLTPYVPTSHVLIIQWDGYVLNPNSWHEEFLNGDYIGAPWHWHPEGQRVGNGGFSLRSKKLLNALRDGEIVVDGNEDTLICHKYRKFLKKKYGITIASEFLAELFSFETHLRGISTFGFHGLFNFCAVMPEKKLVQLIPHIPDHIVVDESFKSLLTNCESLEMWAATSALADRVLQIAPNNKNMINLKLKAAKYGK